MMGLENVGGTGRAVFEVIFSSNPLCTPSAVSTHMFDRDMDAFFSPLTHLHLFCVSNHQFNNHLDNKPLT